MDKLTQYRQIVQEILKEYGEAQPTYGNIEVETIFDTERDHYQIVHRDPLNLSLHAKPVKPPLVPLELYKKSNSP
ncbi:MAG: element excision factor XisI family protein [Dolichospermum sp.]|jgi:hypothetical protein